MTGDWGPVEKFGFRCYGTQLASQHTRARHVHVLVVVVVVVVARVLFYPHPIEKFGFRCYAPHLASQHALGPRPRLLRSRGRSARARGGFAHSSQIFDFATPSVNSQANICLIMPTSFNFFFVQALA